MPTPRISRRPTVQVGRRSVEIRNSGTTIAKIKPLVTIGSEVTPPVKGMVWVNLDSKVYHKEGSRWYGKTKSGKFMSEADAMKAGYTASKE